MDMIVGEFDYHAIYDQEGRAQVVMEIWAHDWDSLTQFNEEIVELSLYVIILSSYGYGLFLVISHLKRRFVLCFYLKLPAE